MNILGKGEGPVENNTSPQLSRQLAQFLNSETISTWTPQQRLDFVERATKAHDFVDLSQDDQDLINEQETEENTPQKDPFQQKEWIPSLRFEEQVLTYLKTHHLSIKEFMATPLFLENEQKIPMLKTLWLHDVLEIKDHNDTKEETIETPEKSSTPSHIMIAFYLAPDTAQKIALDCDGAVAPEDMHVTLMLLGDAGNVPDALVAKLKEVVGDYAKTAAPVHGFISGVGCFTNTPQESDTMPFYASVDIPGLSEWREALRSILPIPIDSTHGFTPHCTLAYTSKDTNFPTQTIPAEPLLFDTLWLCIGDDKSSFVLQGHEHKEI